MLNESEQARLDAEWSTLNAVRELVKLATNGDSSKSTYNHALELGSIICPELLGSDVSLIHQDRMSELTKEYIQRAALASIRDKKSIPPLDLVAKDIEEYESLLKVAKESKNKEKIDKLTRRLKSLYQTQAELDTEKNSENQLIFRDAYRIERNRPKLFETKNSIVFKFSESSILTVRVLHPERTEHITGADLIYERYNENNKTVSLAFIQYKIWENNKVSLSSEQGQRMLGQLDKMRSLLCCQGFCECNDSNCYRFACCSAFLRPTNRLQSPSQKLISRGDYLPICKIERLISQKGEALFLQEDKITKSSINQDLFEPLFNSGKIGSRELTLDALASLYENKDILSERENNILIYAQDYPYAK